MEPLTGEQAIKVKFYRSVGGGLLVRIWALPEVEEYMSRLGGGKYVDVTSYNRYWLPFEKNAVVHVYNLDGSSAGGVLEGGGQAFRLDQPGYPLLATDINMLGGARQVANLSFLRVVGIGKSSGAAFRMAGIFDTGALKVTRAAIATALNGFFDNYIKPVNLRIVLTLEGR